MSGTDQAELTNPNRVAGTVVMVPPPLPEGAIPDPPNDQAEALISPAHLEAATYYVEDNLFGKRWLFWNILTHNPYRGLGSMSKSYVYDAEDALKQSGNTCLYNWWDNNTDPNRCGPVLRAGDDVTFVPKRTDALMHNDQGEILVETIDSHRTLTSGALVPAGAEGMAVGVALNARNPDYLTRVRAPKL